MACVAHIPGKIKKKIFVPAHDDEWLQVVSYDPYIAIWQTDHIPDRWYFIVQPDTRVQYNCYISKQVYDKFQEGEEFFCE